MPILTPDFNDISKPIEPGTHPAKINEATLGVSGSGNPKVVVKMTVTAEGREFPRTSHLVTSGKGAFQFKQLLRACGLPDDGSPVDTDDLVGHEIMVTVEADEYNGQPSDKIVGFMKA